MRPVAAAQLRNVEAVLESLRRGQRQLTRNSRSSIEKAVKQLLSNSDAKADAADESEEGHSYRIDDLARTTNTTVRNVRAYQERGLLHSPVRKGRTAWFDDTHVSRLKLINSMLERGYTSGHIREMLDAWEHGKTLGDVLGIEHALVSEPHDAPKTMGLVAARELAGGNEDLETYVAAGLAEIMGNKARILRPQLLAAFSELRTFGVPAEVLLEIHHDVIPLVDEITKSLVSVGVAHLSGYFDLTGEQTSTEVSELVTMLIRFRSLATTSVTATLDSSIEQSIEELLAGYLAQLIPTQSLDAG